MIWVEKYRPKKLPDIILPKGSSKVIKNFIDDFSSAPHLLLYSLTPGTGKTSLAFVLANELGADLLRLNASDERGIETIRTKIKNFVSTVSFDGSPKIAFLDEADYLTPEAQASLRAMMEEYSYNAKFIISCNAVSKIIAPIQSRTILIDFTKLSKEKIKKRLIKILKKENIKFKDSVLDNIIDVFYPSIRNMINELQKQALEHGKIVQKVQSFENLIGIVKNGIIKGSNPIVIMKSIDGYVQDYNGFLIRLSDDFMSDKNIDKDVRLKFIMLAGKYDYRQRIANQRLQFFSFLVELYNEIQKAR